MNHLPVILVTGANGQLGKELKELEAVYPQFKFVFLSREDLPVHHFELLRNSFKAYHPQYLINCAAYTAVDRAEEEKELAFQVNGEAVGVLAAVCKENDCRFIHISTDYVFDGNATEPYQTDSAVNPQSVYGASKLQGEKLAMKFNDESIIIRTSWVYSEFGKNFVKTMLKLMDERDELNVVSDQIGQPTYAADLADAILQIIADKNWNPGIYHYSNAGVISWFDFANAIKEFSGSNCKLNPILTSQYPTPAKRPAYSVLNTDSFTDMFLIPMKPWNESLKVCIEKIDRSLK